MYLAIGKKYAYREYAHCSDGSEIEEVVLLSAESKEDLLEQMAHEEILFEEGASRELEYKRRFFSLEWMGIVETKRRLYGDGDMPYLEDCDGEGNPIHDDGDVWNTLDSLSMAVRTTAKFSEHLERKEKEKKENEEKMRKSELNKKINAENGERALYERLKEKYENAK